MSNGMVYVDNANTQYELQFYTIYKYYLIIVMVFDSVHQKKYAFKKLNRKKSIIFVYKTNWHLNQTI